MAESQGGDGGPAGIPISSVNVSMNGSTITIQVNLTRIVASGTLNVPISLNGTPCIADPQPTSIQVDAPESSGSVSVTWNGIFGAITATGNPGEAGSMDSNTMNISA